MPTGIKPMLCSLLKQPFDDPEYLFEIKWDGYRIIAYKDDRFVKITSRGGHDYSKKYPSIVGALENLPHNIVLDGEVIVLNSEGKPDFDALQNFNGKRSGVFYYVFDVLWLDGANLMKLPLLERKRILRDVVRENAILRYSDHFEDGIELFRQAEAMTLEGVIAKQKHSAYIPDRRGREWYKIPTEVRDEFVVGGWVESGSRLFRTLLFGAYKGPNLVWIGHAGGGFKERDMNQILKTLKSLEVEKSPFENEVEYDGIVHWVKPELVANIKYATFTRGGKIRKPAIFLGFREDKLPQDVQVPAFIHSGEARSDRRVPAEKADVRTSRSEHSPAVVRGNNWSEVDQEKIRNEDQLDVDGCAVRVYNVDRQLWNGVTKAHLIQYYHAIAPYLLPHIQGRPLSLHLKLKGPRAPGSYIKDMEGREPECATIFTTPRKHHKEGRRDIIDYLVCNNTPTLLYTINLGCIDVNPWTSTIHTPLNPDYIIIDLDPSDKDFTKAIAAARAAKTVFDKHRLKAFPKTSGKTGIHLYIPCRSFTFPQARQIAENICAEIHLLLPGITTTELTVADRGTRLYLDPNQNDYADTVAAPYCVRPAGRPTVSTPVTWRELDDTLDPATFTIHTMDERLKKKGDLFLQVLDGRIAAENDKQLRKLTGGASRSRQAI